MLLVVSVYLSVSISELSCLNSLTYDLDFCYGVDLYLGQAGILGQSSRSYGKKYKD